MNITAYSQKAAVFALLGRVFIAELDRQSLEALQEPSIISILEKLEGGVNSYLENTQWDHQQIESLASEYCHLFILPKKPALSLRASHWMTSAESNHLAQLEIIIDGLDVDASVINPYFTHLPNDHLGVLLYFISAVFSSENEEIQKQGASLVELSLLPWIFRFNQNLLKSTANPLYLASGRLLLELLALEE